MSSWLIYLIQTGTTKCLRYFPDKFWVGWDLFFSVPDQCPIKRSLNGVSTQLLSSGLVAHENSAYRNLALAVSGPFMA